MLYLEVRKWFMLSSVIFSPALLLINAPFGRFTPKNQHSLLVLDGIKSWMVMELVSPMAFIYTFYTSPLSARGAPIQWNGPQTILALCFLVHYTNRAIINPLRTPSRSKSHIIVPLSAVVFNIINGSLMGSYLSSPDAHNFLSGRSSTPFCVGLTLWAFGFVGNILHDEILLAIRRKANSKGKGKAEAGEHYAIPQGGLYTLVSYPNYLCEWIEWLGFAIAASPFPFALDSIFTASISLVFSSLLDPKFYTTIINEPGYLFAPNLSPPWIFFISEILLMLPRAYRGHQWYKSKFGDSYPRQRRVVIPFVL
jgi:3-oxo-5-alpha-steroid 4-dehydrogenase 1